jgi:hypothetical protein
VDTLSEELQKLEAVSTASEQAVRPPKPIIEKEAFLHWLIILACLSYPLWIFNFLFPLFSNTFRYLSYTSSEWREVSGQVKNVTFYFSGGNHGSGPHYYCDFVYEKSNEVFLNSVECNEVVDKIIYKLEFEDILRMNKEILSDLDGKSKKTIKLKNSIPINVFYDEKGSKNIEITLDGFADPTKPDFPSNQWKTCLIVVGGIALAYRELTRDRPFVPPRPPYE